MLKKWKEALKLNPNYTISRYPDAANSLPYLLYDKNDAEEYLKMAEKIVNWVKKFIKWKQNLLLKVKKNY